MYSTTINVNSNIMDLIDNHCNSNNCAKSEFIKKALRIAIKDHSDVSGGLTKYQSKDVNESWMIFHINFLKNECDEFLGARFRFRLSLSKLLLIGVIIFFKIMKCKTNNFDSYTFLVDKKYEILLSEEKKFKKFHLEEKKLE